MGVPLEGPSRQPFRDEDSRAGSTPLEASVSRKISSGRSQQLDSSPLYQQARRDKVEVPVWEGIKDVTLGKSRVHHSQGEDISGELNVLADSLSR